MSAKKKPSKLKAIKVKVDSVNWDVLEPFQIWDAIKKAPPIADVWRKDAYNTIVSYSREDARGEVVAAVSVWYDNGRVLARYRPGQDRAYNPKEYKTIAAAKKALDKQLKKDGFILL